MTTGTGSQAQADTNQKKADTNAETKPNGGGRPSNKLKVLYRIFVAIGERPIACSSKMVAYRHTAASNCGAPRLQGVLWESDSYTSVKKAIEYKPTAGQH